MRFALFLLCGPLFAQVTTHNLSVIPSNGTQGTIKYTRVQDQDQTVVEFIKIGDTSKLWRAGIVADPAALTQSAYQINFGNSATAFLTIDQGGTIFVEAGPLKPRTGGASLGTTGARWRGYMTYLTLNDPDSVAGGIQGHLKNSVDDTYDLGSPAYRWHNAYLSGNITLGATGALLQDSTIRINGAGDFLGLNLYLGGSLAIDNARAATLSALTIDAGSFVIARSGVTRITGLTGGPGAGGILTTYDSTGANVVNRLSDAGLLAPAASISGSGVPLNVTTTDSGVAIPVLMQGANATNLGMELRNTNAGGRKWDLFSSTTGNFDIYDGTAGAFRLSVDSSGNADLVSGAFKMGGTTVFDASRNATVHDLTVGGTCTGCGAGVTSIATTSPISGGTITTTGTISCPTCVTTGGTHTMSGSYTITGTLIVGTNLNFGTDNLWSVGSSSVSPAQYYGHLYNGQNSSNVTTVVLTNRGSAGLIQTYDSTGLTVQNDISRTGIASNVGFIANGNTGLSGTKTPNGTCTLIFTFGILTGGTC